MTLSLLKKVIFTLCMALALTITASVPSPTYALSEDDLEVHGEEKRKGGLLSHALTAELIMQPHPDYGDRQLKMGEAEFQDFGDDVEGLQNAKFKIELKRQDIQLTGPFHVYLNEEKIGMMEVKTIEKLGVLYKFHTLDLDSQDNEDVPIILEYDTIQLVNNDFVFIIGRFFNTDDFIR